MISIVRRGAHHRFSAEQDAAIRRGWASRPLTAIAAELDLNAQQIRSRARALGLKSSDRRRGLRMGAGTLWPGTGQRVRRR
jgi:hypothetical protein